MYETERLILREWQDLDLAPFIAMGQDPLVMEYFPSLLTPEESSGMIDRIKGLKAHFTSCIQIGWRIASQHGGKGYATEGALKCLEIGFNEFNLNEIVSFAAKLQVLKFIINKKIITNQVVA